MACSVQPDGSSDDQAAGPQAFSFTDRAGSEVTGFGVGPTALDSLPPLPAGFEPMSPVVELTPPASWRGEVIAVSYETGEELADGLTPAFLHLNDAGTWEPQLATWNGKGYEADFASFSPAILGAIGDGFKTIGDLGDAAVDWATGKTDPPTDCETVTYDWAGESNPPPDGSFHGCVKKNPADDGSERVEIKIKSNRKRAMWIILPPIAPDYFWMEGSIDGWRVLGPAISLFAGGTEGQVLLPPGRTMTLGYRRPVDDRSLVFSSYETNSTIVASFLYSRVGDLAPTALLQAMITCIASGLDIAKEGIYADDIPVGELLECLVSVQQYGAEIALKADYEKIVASGRFALSEGLRDSMSSFFGAAGENKAAMAKLKKANQAIIVSQLALDSVVSATDAARSLGQDKSVYTVKLAGGGPGDAGSPELEVVDPRLGKVDLPAGTCTGVLSYWPEIPAPLQLTDGVVQIPPVSGGPPSIGLESATTFDFDGDGRGETIGVVLCATGGSGAWNELAVFDAEARPTGLVELGKGINDGTSEYRFGSMISQESELVVTYTGDPAVCCSASRKYVDVYTFSGGTLVLKSRSGEGPGATTTPPAPAQSSYGIDEAQGLCQDGERAVLHGKGTRFEVAICGVVVDPLANQLNDAHYVGRKIATGDTVRISACNNNYTGWTAVNNGYRYEILINPDEQLQVLWVTDPQGNLIVDENLVELRDLNAFFHSCG